MESGLGLSDWVTLYGVLVEPELTAEVTGPRSNIDEKIVELRNILDARLKQNFNISDDHEIQGLLDKISYWQSAHTYHSLSPTPTY